MDAKSVGSKSGSEGSAAGAAHGKQMGKAKRPANEINAWMPGSRILLAGLAVLAICALVVVIAISHPPKTTGPGGDGGWTDTDDGGTGDMGTDEYMKKFTSEADLSAFIKYAGESSSLGYGGYGYYREGAVMAGNMADDGMAVPTAAPQATAGGSAESKSAGASDYSTTNVQVEGVDEADIVKNDGKYIYVLSGGKVSIIDAYPAEDAEKLSEISFKEEETPIDIYINKNMLVIFVQKYESYDYPQPLYEANAKMAAPDSMPSIMPPYSGSGSKTLIKIYDVSDREDPELEKTVKVDGNYFESRMIGDYVYALINEPIPYSPCAYREGGFDIGCITQEITVPAVSVEGEAADSGRAFPDVYYWDIPDYSYRFTTAVAINTQVDEKPAKKYFVMGDAQEMFVSLDNIFVTRTKWMSQQEMQQRVYDEVVIPSLPGDVKDELDDIDSSDKSDHVKRFEKLMLIKEYLADLEDDEMGDLQGKMEEKYRELQDEFNRNREQTVISKIRISEGKITPKETGAVPGTVLNQFSMDEYDGYFRIATTSSKGGDEQSNNVYVLDEDMDLAGEIEDIAPGESIYSARFMGKRAYLVTFKRVDPLFVIDLSSPEHPKILGKLKIPGYSDYLHPYDENHLIGIGKEVDESIDADKVHSSDAVYYTAIQGVKLAIFDVSDVEHPVEMYKEVIGDRGTESEATSDHKAFLFDKEKGILVIPVLLAEVSDAQKRANPDWKTMEGDFTFQGAYVYSISLNNGFKLRGRVTHLDDSDALLKSGYYFSSPYSVKRSLFMDDVLYTISGKKVKMSDLGDVSYINEVDLPYTEDRQYYYDYPMMV